MTPFGEAQAADVYEHANVSDHTAAATPRPARERARRRVRKDALWRDTWVFLGLVRLALCSSPICADHARAVRVRPTLHHEIF